MSDTHLAITAVFQRAICQSKTLPVAMRQAYLLLLQCSRLCCTAIACDVLSGSDMPAVPCLLHIHLFRSQQMPAVRLSMVRSRQMHQQYLDSQQCQGWPVTGCEFVSKHFLLLHVQFAPHVPYVHRPMWAHHLHTRPGCAVFGMATIRAGQQWLPCHGWICA